MIKYQENNAEVFQSKFNQMQFLTIFLINNLFLGKIVVTLFVNRYFGADNALEDLPKEASILNQVMAAHQAVPHPSIQLAALKVQLETATAHLTQDHLQQYQLLLDLPNLHTDLLNLLQSPSTPNLHLIPMALLKQHQIPMDPHKLFPNPPQTPILLHNQPHFQPVQVLILMAHPRLQSTQLQTPMAHPRLQSTQHLTHMVLLKQQSTQHLTHMVHPKLRSTQLQIPMVLPKQQSTQQLTHMAHPKQQSTQPQIPMAHLKLLSILLLPLMVHHKLQ